MLGWSTQLGNKLFGPDPRLEFRKPGQGLDLLAGPDIPSEAPYWDQYLALLDSPADLPHLLPAPALLHALHANPRNLVALVRFAANTLFRLLDTPTFPYAPTDRRDALAAVRILTRIVPLLLAPRAIDAHGRPHPDPVEDAVFWRPERSPRQGTSLDPPPPAAPAEEELSSASDGQFVLEDEDNDGEVDVSPSDPLSAPSPPPTAASQSADEPAWDELPPLAERLLGALVDLLFVPGLTIAETLAPTPGPDLDRRNVVTYAIWEPGIASSTPAPPVPTSHFTARVEILALLTLLISLPSLLTPPGLFPTVPNRWRDALVSGRAAGRGDRNVVLCLLCSTLNTALGAGAGASAASGGTSPGGESGGEGGTGGESLRARAARLAAETARRTGAAAGSAAPSSTVAAALLGGDEASARHALVGAALHFLGAVLLEHAPPPAPSSSGGVVVSGDTRPPPPTASSPNNNLFAFYLAKLHRPVDLGLLVSGTLGLLEAALTGPLLGGSGISGGGSARRDPAWATETLVVFSRALALNPKLGAYLACAGSDVVAMIPRVLATLEACALEWREDDAALGLVRAASFALQTVSAEVARAAFFPPPMPLSRGPGTEGLDGGGEEEMEARQRRRRRDQLARALSAPLDAAHVGPKLAAVVRRQVMLQGIEPPPAGSDRNNNGEGKGHDRRADVSCAEFLVISLHAVLLPSPNVAPHAPSRAALSTLYPSRLLLLSNLSPFLRDLGHEAATRLVRIWLAFSAPSWVMMEEGNPRLMFYLLETFNNVVTYHLDSNPHLLYNLTITLKRFELLSNFTLAQGVAEARRLRAARRDRQQAGRRTPRSRVGASSPSGPDSPSLPLATVAAMGRGNDPEEEEAAEGGTSERARGKRPERDRTLSISSSVADLNLASPNLGHAGPSSSSTSVLWSPRSNSATRDTAADPENPDVSPFVGRNGFVPTEEWVASWRDGLPLDTLLVLLSELRPLLAQHDPSFPSTSAPPSTATIAHLRTLLASPALTALLPARSSTPPSPPLPLPKIRSFTGAASPAVITWLASLLYGRLYLSLLPYLRDTLPVQLFAVASAPSSSSSLSSGGATVLAGGLIAGWSDGLGAEMERVGRSAVQVGGKVGGAMRDVLGRFSSN